MSLIDVVMVEITIKNFDVEPPVPTSVRLTNAPFDVEMGGEMFIAAGDLLGVGDFNRSYELIVDGLDITLSGVNAAYQNLVNSGGFKRAPIDIWLAQVPEGSNVVQSAVYYHRGFMGTPMTEHDETNGSITVSSRTESAFKSLDRVATLMTNSLAHHQSLTNDPNGVRPKDLFFQYTASTGFGEEQWIS